MVSLLEIFAGAGRVLEEHQCWGCGTGRAPVLRVLDEVGRATVLSVKGEAREAPVLRVRGGVGTGAKGAGRGGHQC